jgi:hypothetical protein
MVQENHRPTSEQQPRWCPEIHRVSDAIGSAVAVAISAL